ncbi:MAG: AAA family ATPase, partial [Paracoccaceae bacterium]
MGVPVYQFSDDQAEAFDRVSDLLRSSGVDLEESILSPPGEDREDVLAVIGRAGSGKTMLLVRLYEAMDEAGVDVISGDYEGRKRKDRRTLAILAPTNKAASVLRNQGVPATTIHRILYTP